MTTTTLPDLKSLHKPLPRQNKAPSLPTTHILSRRPIQHAPIPSVHAGPTVPKAVYVSRRTPVIVAVKRVKAYLRQIERRALQSVDAKADGAAVRPTRKRKWGETASMLEGGDRRNRQRLAEMSELLGRQGEVVLVKASGRAMEQALRVAEWFRTREDEMVCEVEVRAGSVSVVDDVVEREGRDSDADGDDHVEVSAELTGGDTTLELLGDDSRDGASREREQTEVAVVEGKGNEDASGGEEKKTGADAAEKDASEREVTDCDDSPAAKKRRRRRKKPVYDPDDVPEARIRWVKTIEIAISLKA